MDDRPRAFSTSPKTGPSDSIGSTALRIGSKSISRSLIAKTGPPRFSTVVVVSRCVGRVALLHFYTLFAGGPIFEKIEESSMTEPNCPKSNGQESDQLPGQAQNKGSTRRSFLSQVSGAAAATLGAAAMISSPPASAARAQEPSRPDSGNGARARALRSYANRGSAAQAELNIRVPNEVTNGDEQRFANHIGNFSKGLVHNGIGEVDGASYASLLRAVNNGDSRLFEQIQLGGTVPLVDPQAGLAFDLEGTDSHQLAIGTPPVCGEPGDCRHGARKLLDGLVSRREFHAIRKRAAHNGRDR